MIKSRNYDNDIESLVNITLDSNDIYISNSIGLSGTITLNSNMPPFTILIKDNKICKTLSIDTKYITTCSAFCVNNGPSSIENLFNFLATSKLVDRSEHDCFIERANSFLVSVLCVSKKSYIKKVKHVTSSINSGNNEFLFKFYKNKYIGFLLKAIDYEDTTRVDLYGLKDKVNILRSLYSTGSLPDCHSTESLYNNFYSLIKSIDDNGNYCGAGYKTSMLSMFYSPVVDIFNMDKFISGFSKYIEAFAKYTYYLYHDILDPDCKLSAIMSGYFLFDSAFMGYCIGCNNISDLSYHEVCNKCYFDNIRVDNFDGVAFKKDDDTVSDREEELWYRSRETALLDGNIICSECGFVIPSDEDSYSYGDGTICESCYEDSFFTCDSCGAICSVDNRFGDEDLCPECYHRLRNDNMPGMNYPYCVEEYHYGRSHDLYRNRFFDGDSDNCDEDLIMGFELEFAPLYQFKDADFNEIDSISDEYNDYVHFETDTSLPPGGIEMISVPCSLRYHRNVSNLKDILFRISEAYYGSNDVINCGFHVHLDRAFFTDPIQFAKLDIVINNAKEFWYKVARRDNSSYVSYKEKSKNYAGNNVGSDHRHYSSVNFENSDTIEIRIAKGSLKYSTIVGTLEIYDALANACRSNKNNIDEILSSPNIIISEMISILSENSRYSGYGLKYLKQQNIDIDKFIHKQ